MKWYRLFPVLLVILTGLSWFPKAAFWRQHPAEGPLPRKTAGNANTKKLQQKANQARAYIRKRNFNPRLCLLADMSLPSGQPRLFVYDLKKDSLLYSGLVAHGNCYENWLEGRRYSNKVGSGCTSLGRYRVGAFYRGKWGDSFRLHGLDSSNSRAFERTVVLHGHSCVPESAVEEEICQSNGCPTVSPALLQTLKTLILSSPRPLLLWMYE